MLPAVPMLTLKFCGEMFWGEKESSFEAKKAFSIFALHNAPIAFTEARCCGLSPGFGLFARMFFKTIGF